MKKILAISGSSIVGRDPWASDSWSGLSRNLLLACQDIGFLDRAFGVEAPQHIRYGLIAKNFSFNKSLWLNRFYLDTDYYRALSKAIESQLNEEDFNSNILQLGAIYNVPKIVKGRTRVFSYHDGNIANLIKSPFMPAVSKRKVDKAFAWEKEVYEGLDKIFVMSDYLRNSFIEDFGIPEEKVFNIGVGMNFTVPETLTKDYSNKEAIFIGANFSRKGGETLVDAFKKVRSSIPTAKLHIVGPWELPDCLKTDVPGIEFHGFLSRDNPEQLEEFQDLMNRCTLFVLPSTYEPFGVSALEAMSYGMPCVLTNQWAFPEIVTEGRDGALVECNNVDSLAEALIDYLGDDEKRAVHGAFARDSVVSRYSWAKVASRMKEATT